MENIIEKYNVNVPRYTSYPPATQFIDIENLQNYFQCIKSIDKDKKVSLYVHIPFCHSLCYYCGCNTKIVNKLSPIESYVETLLKEIENFQKNTSFKYTVSQLHFGGGSPNYASCENLKEIITALKSVFIFDTQTEIHMECDPRLLNDNKIASYIELGVSRFSLGIQDFDATVQKAINRIQPFGTIKSVIDLFHQHNMSNINFDLIIGLPNQTIDTVEKTIQQTLSLKPSRVAVFPYAHVPWMKKHQKILEEYPMPSAEDRFEMNEIARSMFLKAGYVQVGMDHFALSDDPLAIAQSESKLQRNFQGYTTDEGDCLIGFGLSSISQFQNASFQNACFIKDYKGLVDDGKPTVVKEMICTENDVRVRHAIQSLLCHFKLDKLSYTSFLKDGDKMKDLLKDKLVAFDVNGDFYITNKGKPFARVVAACFDHYYSNFNTGEQKHAKAV
ncbi:MAG: oxygen-independent coproporphyrinogen III oxidase [Magnetococcales bacterium]|nr:oxygen-independent coproporphyrinogen III oxidase [Magnetococcales bacterium]